MLEICLKTWFSISFNSDCSYLTACSHRIGKAEHQQEELHFCIAVLPDNKYLCSFLEGTNFFVINFLDKIWFSKCVVPRPESPDDIYWRRALKPNQKKYRQCTLQIYAKCKLNMYAFDNIAMWGQIGNNKKSIWNCAGRRHL